MWVFLFFLSLILGISYRSYIVNYTHSLSAGCSWCFIVPVWSHDILFLATSLAFFGIALLFKSKKWRVLLIFSTAPLVFFFWIDIVVYKTLNYRVRLEDVILFSKETSAIFTFIEALKFSPKELSLLIAGAISICILVICIFIMPRSIFWGRILLSTALLLGFTHLLFVKKDPDYIFNDTVINFLEVNYPSGVDKKYKHSQEKIINNKTNQEFRVGNKNTSNNNIILLIVESLSAYHLNTLLPNKQKFTPFLDDLAKNNSYFTNYFANGFTTDGGLISLLTGRVPVPSIGRYRSVDAFQGFDCVEDSLPLFMKSRGYETNFFSNSSLEFTNLGGWANSIGFDYVEGPKNDFYKDWEKGLFDAVEDRALFSRFVNWMDARKKKANKPYMAVLMTHSTHPPFVDPVTKSNIEAKVYQYMDRSVEKFFNELTTRNYFSQGGILLITGDHRAYTPISPSEQAFFGETARSRIPFIAVGNTGLIKGETKIYAQQVDLLNSMKEIFSQEEFSIPNDRGIFLGNNTKQASFILHASGKDRDQVKVFFPGGKVGSIKLNGDQTVWQGEKPSNWENILQAIATDRTSRGPATINYVDYLYKVTFDPEYGSGKFATGSSCTMNYPVPNY